MCVCWISNTLRVPSKCLTLAAGLCPLLLHQEPQNSLFQVHEKVLPLLKQAKLVTTPRAFAYAGPSQGTFPTHILSDPSYPAKPPHMPCPFQQNRWDPHSVILFCITMFLSFIALTTASNHNPLMSLCLTSFSPCPDSSLSYPPPYPQHPAQGLMHSKCVIPVWWESGWMKDLSHFLPLPLCLHQGFSKWGPQTRGINTSWELVSDADSQAPPQNQWMKHWGWPSSVFFIKWFWCTFKYGSSCSRPFCASEITSLPFNLLFILQVLAPMFTLPGSLLFSLTTQKYNPPSTTLRPQCLSLTAKMYSLVLKGGLFMS